MKIVALSLPVALLLVALLAPPSAGQPPPAQGRDGLYGRELMTLQEQDAYRRKMWGLRTEAEREHFRREHHRQMQERARDLGVVLPDDPVDLGRPYFERSKEGGADRLSESSAPSRSVDKGEKSAVRRWREGRESGAPADGRSGDGPSATKRPWPPERNTPIRPEEMEKGPPDERFLPGAGR